MLQDKWLPQWRGSGKRWKWFSQRSFPRSAFLSHLSLGILKLCPIWSCHRHLRCMLRPNLSHSLSSVLALYKAGQIQSQGKDLEHTWGKDGRQQVGEVCQCPVASTWKLAVIFFLQVLLLSKKSWAIRVFSERISIAFCIASPFPRDAFELLFMFSWLMSNIKDTHRKIIIMLLYTPWEQYTNNR